VNYVELHLGDWAQAVAHLSMIEEAVYLRLLRRYYADEKPLPADLAACQRLAGARTQDERQAVEVVLGEFFALTDDGYRNKRADEEIAKVEAKKDKAAASAKARWNATAKPSQCETDANAMRPHSERNANAMLTSHQTPDTNQEQEQKGRSAPVELPDWLPADVWADWHGYRNSRKGWTNKARALSLRTLTTLWQAGHDPRRVVEQSIERGWTGLFPMVGNAARASPQASQSKQMQGMAAILGVTHESNDTSRVVLDINPAGPSADVRQLPARLPGC
jgi:uncharacterized protein YdaU (DUF1376 family)